MSSRMPAALEKMRGTVTIGNRLYIADRSVTKKALAVLRHLGYRTEEHGIMDHVGDSEWHCDEYRWTAELTDDKVLRAKCLNCKHVFSDLLVTHDSKCPNCKKLLFLQFTAGANVEFCFFGDYSAQRLYSGVAEHVDHELRVVYLRTDSIVGVSHEKSKPKLETALERYKGSWQIIEHDGVELLAVGFLYKPEPRDDKTKLLITSSDKSYCNIQFLQQWNGKTYHYKATLPVFDFIQIYEAWRWNPLKPSSDLWDHVLEVAGIPIVPSHDEDADVLHDNTWRDSMITFIKHFTTLDAKQWNKEISRLPNSRAKIRARVQQLCSSP